MTREPEQYLTSIDDPQIYVAPDMVSLLVKNGERFYDKDLYILLDDGYNESYRITFGRVVEQAKAVAAELQKIGKKGDHVLLLFPAGIQFVISLYGCFLAGMVAIPAYPPRRKKVDPRFLSILHDASPDVILSTETIHQDLEALNLDDAGLDKINKVKYENIDLGQNKLWRDPKVSSEDIVLLQYTSGSTGQPKGIMVSHGNMIHNLECLRQSFGFDEYLINVSWLPNFHDMGLIGCLIEPAYVGGVNIIMPPIKFIQNPANWIKNISRYKATCAGGPNFGYDYCVDKITEEDDEGLDLSTLKTLFNGSEPIRRDTLEHFSEKYKKTDLNPNSSIHVMEWPNQY